MERMRERDGEREGKRWLGEGEMVPNKSLVQMVPQVMERWRWREMERDGEICEVRLSYDGHTAVFLSVYRPPPSRQNKLTNTMFLEQFSDLLESYVSCDRLFVVGDLNVHFDKPSDPSTSALNVVLDNLSLH